MCLNLYTSLSTKRKFAFKLFEINNKEDKLKRIDMYKCSRLRKQHKS